MIRKELQRDDREERAEDLQGVGDVEDVVGIK
jgi:hypothetical protein